ncbi:Rab-GAP TBC domain-containing protein [Entamoeba marina]
MFVDKVDYEGDFKICAEVYKYMRSGNYQKLRRLCCLGIPRKVRAYVWYSLLIQPTQTSEIFDLSNKSQFELYWKNIEEFSIDTDQFVVNYDIDIIDFDVARTYPIGYDLIFQLDCIRSILRRVLRMYVYLHPNGYFQGLNDIVSILLIVLLDMYTHQNLVVDSVVLLNKNKFDIIEATTFIEFHAENVIIIWDRLIADPKQMGFKDGVICFGVALIEGITLKITDLNDIEYVNTYNRSYCKELDGGALSQLLNHPLSGSFNILSQNKDYLTIEACISGFNNTIFSFTNELHENSSMRKGFVSTLFSSPITTLFTNMFAVATDEDGDRKINKDDYLRKWCYKNSDLITANTVLFRILDKQNIGVVPVQIVLDFITRMSGQTTDSSIQIETRKVLDPKETGVVELEAFIKAMKQ